MLAKASVLLLAILYIVTGEEQTCTNGVDSCQFTCGSVKVILNDSKIEFPVSGINDKYTYSYYPCTGVECGGIGADTALCQALTDDKSRTYALGKLSTVKWTMLSTDPYTFTAVYTGGDDSRSAEVTLIKNGTDTAVLEVISATTSLYTFTLSANSLGVQGGGKNIAGLIGFVFIMVFVLAIIAYLIAGALIMYFAKGARGVEIIPNYHFWKDFPFLIKDGALFVISPCYKKDGYEKI